MNLRYIRVDEILYSLKNRNKEIDEIKATSVDLAKNINLSKSQKIIYYGLCVILQAKIEDIIKEICTAILFGFPEKLSQESSIKIKPIIEGKDFFRTRRTLIDKEMKEMSFTPFTEQVNYLIGLLNVNIPLHIKKDILILQELSATRNIIVHSNGKVDKGYLDIAGINARVSHTGEIITVDNVYIDSSCTIIKKLFVWIYDEIKVKFQDYTKSRLIKDAWNACFNSPILKFEDWWIINSKGEVIGFQNDNEHWGAASSGERALLALFSQMYTGTAKYPEDLDFWNLDGSWLSHASQLILARDYIFR